MPLPAVETLALIPRPGTIKRQLQDVVAGYPVYNVRNIKGTTSGRAAAGDGITDDRATDIHGTSGRGRDFAKSWRRKKLNARNR
jgi:hypothetical protein